MFTKIQSGCLEKYHCEIVLTRHDPKEQSLVISQIRCLDSGKGHGTLCMEYLIRELEYFGIKRIDIVACPLGGMGPCARSMGVIRLVKWYTKFGFEFIRYSKCGDYIANAEMELNIKPSKLVAFARTDKTPEKSAGKESFVPPTTKGDF